MNLDSILKICIEIGKEADPRSQEEINKILEEKNRKYGKMEIKDLYDKDELFNPYIDSGIHLDLNKDINKVFVGIDTECQEIVLADRLGVDLVFGHHPEGKALLKLANVMDIHEASLVKSGIPVNIAEKLIIERQKELRKNLHSINYNRAINAAKLLKMPFMNIHTIADNLANKYMENYLIDNSFEKIADFIEKVVIDIEEYKISTKDGIFPNVINGLENSRLGKTFVKFNGGTSGNKKIFKHLERQGISTFICMHLPEDQLLEAKKYNINVIVMPHMASDSLGMNLLIDQILLRLNLNWNIVAGSGFIRYNRRNK